MRFGIISCVYIVSFFQELSPEDLLAIKYDGIRPAPGYPTQPDHTEKRALWKVIKPDECGMELTEHLAMLPAASVSALVFANPASQYFAVGKVDKDQVAYKSSILMITCAGRRLRGKERRISARSGEMALADPRLRFG